MAQGSIPPDSPTGCIGRIYQQQFAPDAAHNLDALAAIRTLRRMLDQEEDMAALTAKKNGATWQQIADALGMTRQRAHQRWGNITRFAGWDSPAERWAAKNLNFSVARSAGEKGKRH